MPSVPYTKPGEQYVFGHFPHTCFPMGSFLSFPLCGDAATGVPGPMQALVATVLLKVPFYKHIFAWLGCHPADKPVMLDLLRQNSVGVIVEGVAGIFLGPTRHQERVYLRKRKGFVKAAIQAGKGKEILVWVGEKRAGDLEAGRRRRQKNKKTSFVLLASFTHLAFFFFPSPPLLLFCFQSLKMTIQTWCPSTTSAPPSS